MKKDIIATIKLDNGEGRGKIFAKLENNDFFQAGGQVYTIYMEQPDGNKAKVAIAPQRTMAEVENEIEAVWGQGWDLQWEKA